MEKYIIFLVLILCSCTAYNDENSAENSIYSYERRKSETISESTISVATTEIIDKSENRLSNISLACKSISGIKISPGEEFSFNNTTGKRSEEYGYKVAPVLVDGEKSYGTGGGVCQVSSTIYMSALFGGFEITEHHNHSEEVSYAPNGKDATVVYGVKDFKFLNNTDYDVYIYVWMENESVISKIIRKQ